MTNSICLSGPAFSISGYTSYSGQLVDFQLSFDSEADAGMVMAYDWYLDGIAVINQNRVSFNNSVSCGSHILGARILSEEGWSGMQTLAFKTCHTVLSVAIVGPDTVEQGTSAAYQVIETFTDGSTEDVTALYTFTSDGGTFAGATFTPAIDDTDGSSGATLYAGGEGLDPLTRAVTITGTGGNAGVLVVDIFYDGTLNVIGLVDNAEITDNHVAAYTGHNIVPAPAAPAGALVLASDLVADATLKWRFEFNIAKLLAAYPGSGQFVFYIKGRGDAAGALNGAFVLKTFASAMILVGSPGGYVPSVTGVNIGLGVNYSSSVVGGANGSYLEADLTTMLKFTYTIYSKRITYTTA